MQDTEVKIGQVYAVKVNKRVSPVRLDSEHKDGGWQGTNLRTNKQVHVKSPDKLIKLLEPNGKRPPAGRALKRPRKGKAVEQAKPATGGEKKPTRGNTAKTKTRSSMTALDAAVKVLGEAKGSPLSCGEMIERMLDKGYWKTDGKTPAATLYSAVLREITTKRKESRFRKVERGKFELVKGA